MLSTNELMEIRIHLHRPILTLSVITVALLSWSGVISFHLPGGSEKASLDAGGVSPAATITGATQDIDRERVKQAVLEKREEILRYNVQILEQQALQTHSPDDMQELNDARAVLIGIIKERGQSEKLLLSSLQDMWEAEGTVYSVNPRPGEFVFDWPVEPSLGISAHFEDKGYVARFGFPHHAVDIPTRQGTPIAAPAEGTVSKVSMNGLGYSYIVLAHEDGLETIYGHVIDAVVQEGDHVALGQVIGHSGGTPGTKGAGLTTTGPHLHFAVKQDGALVDPMKFLPTLGQ